MESSFIPHRKTFYWDSFFLEIVCGWVGFLSREHTRFQHQNQFGCFVSP